MTIVDWVIVAILIASTFSGIMRGFLRSVFALAGLLLGVILAAWNYDRVAHLLRPLIHSEMVADATGFLVIALVVMVLAALAGVVLSKVVHKIGLGCLDRLIGGIFGLFQGALLVTLVILVAVAFFPKAQWLTNSRLPRYFFGACHLTTHVTPQKLSERVRQELKSLEKASPEWMHPPSGGV
ncbi:MAG TPA: CvpA family protein [Terracidiphilus sp.]|nr:CvpA family protein [Terracidiphilus sp.]